MRCKKAPIVLLLLLVVGVGSYSQPMVQTPKDIHMLCQKDNLFVGKPLEFLLKEIKPVIRLVLAREGWVPEVAPLFTFFFTSMDVYKKYRQKDSFPLRLTVYLREPFKWEWEKRKGHQNRDHYLDWTKEDAVRYGHLIVSAIRVAGEYNACDYNADHDECHR